MSPDGSAVFVTGTGGVLSDYTTVAYDASTGAQLWIASYTGSDNLSDRARSIAVSPDGSTVFVTGESDGYGWQYEIFKDFVTIAYSAVTGSQLWLSRWGDLQHEASAKSIAVSADGATVYVAGTSDGPDYLTIAYAASSGEELWLAQEDRSFGCHYVDDNRILALSPDGTMVFLTGPQGRYHASCGFIAFSTVAYAASTGDKLWGSLYEGPGNFTNVSRSLAVSPDGATLFVTGVSYATDLPGGSDFVTAAYATSNGAQRWVARHDGPGYSFNSPTSVAVSPDGSTVFVTGYSANSYATFAYSASTGAQRWSALYDEGQNYNRANAIAVSPDGSMVIVTGFSYLSGSTDYATVAYSTSACSSGQQEAGIISGPLHDAVEPQVEPISTYLHGVNCDLVSANGL